MNRAERRAAASNREFRGVSIKIRGGTKKRGVQPRVRR